MTPSHPTWNNELMPTEHSVNVSLSPELERFVKGRVATGRYQTASEVVREGLRLLEAQERQGEEALNALKATLDRGAAQADRGEFIDPGQVLGNIDARRRQRAGVKP